MMTSFLEMIIPAFKCISPLLRKERLLLLRFFVTAFGWSGFSILNIVLVRGLFSSLLGETSPSAKWMVSSFGMNTSLALAVVLVFVVNCLGIWCNYKSQMVLMRLIKLLKLELLEQVLRTLLRFSALHFEKLAPGDVTQTIMQDVDSISSSLREIGTIILNGMTTIALVATAIWLSPQLSFWVLGVMPLAVIPIAIFARSIQRHSFTVRKTSYAVVDFVMEIILGIRIIKAYQAEDRECQITLEKASRYYDDGIEQHRLLTLGNAIMEVLTTVGLVLVVVVGSLQIIRGSLTWSQLFAFLLAIRSMNLPLNRAFRSFLNLQIAAASVNRITELLQTPPDLESLTKDVRLTKAPSTIAFDKVAFGYRDSNVIFDASFQIAAGESVAIVGPSGTGKSTLLNLFTRFFDPTSGRVLYDDCDIRDFRLADIYSMVAVVSQEPFLFGATVRENIRIGRPEASDLEVEQAAISAFVHDDIMGFPQGYDTVLGIGGRQLSRGQSQRINLARAFLKDAPVLLLDEATSSLDAVAEMEVQNAINHLMQGRTSFFVTHKLATQEHADRVILVDGVRPPTIGTSLDHYRDSAIYRQMCEIQNYVP